MNREDTCSCDELLTKHQIANSKKRTRNQNAPPLILIALIPAYSFEKLILGPQVGTETWNKNFQNYFHTNFFFILDQFTCTEEGLYLRVPLNVKTARQGSLKVDTTTM